MATSATGTTDDTPVVASAERRRNARGEGDRLRGDLLDAATELMAEFGTIDGISLRAVARRAGVSPTAVYRHFDDHVDLLRESVARCWSDFYATMVTARDSSTDPFEAFRAAGDAYVRFATERSGEYRVLFSNRIQLDMTGVGLSDATDRPEFGDDPGSSAFDVLVGLVAAIQERTDDGRDPYFVAVQVHTWIHGMVDLIGCHPDAAWPPMDTMLDGLSAALDLDPS